LEAAEEPGSGPRVDSSRAGLEGGASSAVPTLLCLLAALVLPVLLLRSELTHHAGWDESMHAALPAARLLLSLSEPTDGPGFFQVLFACEQYPFVYPIMLAIGQGLGTVGEASARFTSGMIWGLSLAGVLLIARQGLVRGQARAGRLVASLIALAFAAASPMAQAFARTLFLELPFACAASVALLTWMRRHPPTEARGRARELAAGVALAAAFFTKFNYGGLLLAALGVDWMIDAVQAARGGNVKPFVKRSLILIAPLLMLSTWWFLLPLPAGADVAASHRHAFMGFLGGNMEMASASMGRRLMHFSSYLSPTPALAVIALIGLATSLLCLRDRGVRALWLSLAALGLPVLFHPFHLERFWLPVGVPLWALVGIGFGALYARLRVGSARRTSLLALALLSLASSLAAVDQALWLATQMGEMPDDPVARTQARRVLDGWIGSLDARMVPTAGLRKSEADAVLDLVAAEVGPRDRFGWLGLSSELSPAVLHIGLFERGGSPGRLLRDASLPVDVTPVPGAAEPSWDRDQFQAFVSNYDLLFLTDPPDLKDRENRRSVRDRWHRRLVEELGWSATRIAVVPIDRGSAGTTEVGLFVCRPPQ
jgi:hypothetical protein